MKKHYNIDTFLDETPQTKTDVIDQKILLLYHHHKLLCSRGEVMDDEREPLVRKVLDTYESETQMTIATHDVIWDREGIDTWLKRKGVM
jgi:hypothetical protein